MHTKLSIATGQHAAQYAPQCTYREPPDDISADDGHSQQGEAKAAQELHDNAASMQTLRP